MEKKILREAVSPEEIKLVKDFNKFSRLIKQQLKLKNELEKIAKENKENVMLQKYITLIEMIEKLGVDIDTAKKGYLYESASVCPEFPLENDIIKLTVVKSYKKMDFDKVEFEKDNPVGSEMYNKYMKEKTVKGNIKVILKEGK